MSPALLSQHPICVVDAFTREPFRGNPAAVCILENAREDDWMQRVAAEMNLSETAFVVPRGGGWDLRWFTPTVEVKLCGHATLAAAHALWSLELSPSDRDLCFETRSSGKLICRREAGWIAMDFPARPAQASAAPEGLLDALGCSSRWIGRSADDYLVEVESAENVRALEPQHALLATLPVRGIIVTAPADGDGFDFVSRFFAPGSGVPEDPVTGSAHCTLAPYWAGRLGRSELRGWQASRRGGEVRTRLRGDRVELRGAAITIWQGILQV